MLDWVLIFLTIALGSAGGGGETRQAEALVTEESAGVNIGESVEIGSDVVIGGDVAAEDSPQVPQAEEDAADTGDTALSEPAPEADGAAEAPSFEAEPQTPTGKFTTATEIRPILEATRMNWLAIGAEPGNDFLYVTHIWSWRCGLKQMKFSLNGGPLEEWPLPPCHEGTASPNAITDSDGLPLKMFAPGEVQAVAVWLLLDDLTQMSTSYQRSDIVLP